MQGSHQVHIAAIGFGLMVSILSGCKKDIEQPGPDSIEAPSPNVAGFSIGDTAGLYVNCYDTIYNSFGGSVGQWVVHPLSIYNGPQPDLYLRFYFNYTLGQGPVSRMELVKAQGSDLLFNGILTQDTIRSDLDSLLAYDAGNTYPYSLTVDLSQGCSVQGEVDTIIDVFEPYILEANEAIDTSAYLDNSYALKDWSGSSYSAPVPQLINDSTILYRNYDYLSDCFFIPVDEPFYLSFARLEGGSLKKGWIGLEQVTGAGIRVGCIAMEP